VFGIALDSWVPVLKTDSVPAAVDLSGSIARFLYRAADGRSVLGHGGDAARHRPPSPARERLQRLSSARSMALRQAMQGSIPAHSATSGRQVRS
jgi:hypothetical protein